MSEAPAPATATVTATLRKPDLSPYAERSVKIGIVGDGYLPDSDIRVVDYARDQTGPDGAISFDLALNKPGEYYAWTDPTTDPGEPIIFQVAAAGTWTLAQLRVTTAVTLNDPAATLSAVMALITEGQGGTLGGVPSAAFATFVYSTLLSNNNLAADLAAESGFVFMIGNLGEIYWGALRPDGTTVIQKPEFGSGTVVLDALAADVQSGLAQAVPVESGLPWSAGPGTVVLIGVNDAGELVGPQIIRPTAGTVTLATLAADTLGQLNGTTSPHETVATTGSSPTRKITVETSWAGKITIPDAGDCTNPATRRDGVRYDSTSSGVTVGMFSSRPYVTTVREVSDPTQLIIPGDSFSVLGTGTAGYAAGESSFSHGANQQLAGAATVTTQGVIGQASGDIGVRQGGIVLTFTAPNGIAGDTSTANPVTFVAASNGSLSFNNGGSDYYFAGSIGGVTGILRHALSPTQQATPTQGWTFTRTSSGSPVAATTAVLPFTCTGGGITVNTIIPSGAAYRGVTQILWPGRNNVVTGTLRDLPGDLAAMVAYQSPWIPRTLILGIANALFEPAGTPAHDAIIAANAATAATYGARFFDIRTWMRDNGLAALGITTTTQDTADIAADCVPTSLHNVAGGVVDRLHWSPAAYELAGRTVVRYMSTAGLPGYPGLGWY